MRVALIKTVGLLVLCAGLQVFVSVYGFPVSVSEMLGDDNARVYRNLEQEAFSSKDESLLLFFADSVDFYTSPDDTDTRSISMMVEDRSGLRLIAVSGRAYHAGIFADYLEYALREDRINIQTVIVSVNLRSFSTYWIKNPEWQHNDLRRFLQYDSPAYRIFFRPLRAFKYYRDRGMNAYSFRRIELADEHGGIGRLGDYIGDQYRHANPENIRRKVELAYIEPIDSRNPRIKGLKRIVDLAEAHGAALIVYLTPVDYQACRAYAGPRMMQRLLDNTSFIKDQIPSVEDLVFALKSDQFYYGEPYPNEHLTDSGRLFVADKILGWIKQ